MVILFLIVSILPSNSLDYTTSDYGHIHANVCIDENFFILDTDTGSTKINNAICAEEVSTKILTDTPMIPDTSVCIGSDVTIDFPPGAETSIAETVLFEDFEDDEIFYTVSIPEFTDGGQDYFIRTDGSNISGESFLNVQGSSYFAAQDIDGDGASPNQTLTFSNINISGLTNLDFLVFIAEDDNGSSENWDATDFVHITYSIDGGPTENLIWIENDGATSNSAPFIDSDFDGTGDGAEITSTFVQYFAPLMGTGAVLNLTIEMDLNDGGTDIAFDNIQLTGDRVGAGCTYNVYDSDPASGESVLLSESVTSYSITAVSADTTFYVTKVQDGCESPADRVTVLVRDLSSSIIDTSICIGDVIQFNGQLISTSGSFMDTLTNAAMCDSIITLNVMVEPLSALSMVTDTLCIDETQTVDLSQYESSITSASGTFSYSEQEIIRSDDLFISEYVEGSSDNKCIEIYNNTGATVDLSTYAINFYFNGSTSISRSLGLSGMLATSDTYVLCDDGIDLALGVVADSLYGGSFYNGDDAISLSNNGVEIDIIGQIGTDPGTQWGSGLTATQNHTLVRSSNIFDGDRVGSDAFDPSLEWIGFNQDVVMNLGTHEINDSIIVTPLTSTVVSVEDGDVFIVEFTDEETGCMSNTTITFEVRDTSSTVLDMTICEGESIDFNGQVLKTTGSFRDTLINMAQCDSFVTLNLTVIESIEIVLDTSICEGEFVEFGGVMITESGMYRDTSESSMTGCDSIVILEVSVEEISGIVIDTSICAGEIINFGGFMIDMSGTFRDTLTNAAMCDSIITLNVMVEPLSALSMVTDTLCIDETQTVDLSQYESSITSASGTFSYSEQEIIRSDDLFISEYVEGSSDNKCIEIYNNTGATVDLSTYAINFYFNGSTSISRSLGLSGMLATSDTYVLCDDGIDLALGVVADSLYGGSFYNGDDAISLSNNGVEIDIIGQIGTDPGTQWGSGLTATQNHTLVRSSNIFDGDRVGSDAFDPSLEWIGFNQDVVMNLGTHEINDSFIITQLTNTIVSADVGDVFLVEFTDQVTGCIANTTITLEIEQCLFDLALIKTLSPGQSNTVQPGDIVSFDLTILNQGEVAAYDIIVQDYVPAGLIFDPTLNDAPWGADAIYNAIDILTAGSDTTITIQLIVAEDATAVSLINSAEIIFAAATQGGPLAIDQDGDLSETGDDTTEVDNDINDGQDDFDVASLSLCGDIRFTEPTLEDVAICDPSFDGVVTLVPTATQLPANLFFSEYIEGPTGANNKCLEIYNGTGAPVSLAGYAVNLYNTAPRLMPNRTLNLTGIIADGDVLVLCNNSSFTDEVDIVDNDVINYNGDDIVTLTQNDVIIDAIGRIGVDPGAQWRSGGVSTMDQTIRRLPTIIAGDSDGFDIFLPDQEWTSAGDDRNDPSDLGQHSITPQVLNSFTFFDGDPASGGTPIATQVSATEIDISIETSPIEIWVTTHPESSTCMSDAIPVRVAIRNEESTMSCIGSVNVSVEADCSIQDLPVSALYLGTIDPLFLSVDYRTEDGTLIDPTDVSLYRGNQFTYEVIDTCTDIMCWGFVNLDFKQIPEPVYAPTDIICCSDDYTQFIDLTLEEVIESLANSCHAAPSNPLVAIVDTMAICDTSIYTISYFADFNSDSRKVNQLLYQQSIVVLPVDIDSIISPGSYNRLDSVALVDTIIINECTDFIASPLNVAVYWADVIDPNDQNRNGLQDGIPFAYPHILKGFRTIQDTLIEFVDIEVIHEDSLVMINDSIWARVDVIEKLVDTVLTVTDREVPEYQLFEGSSTCNIISKYSDLTKDGCYEDSEILRSWTIIDWCSKTVKEVEQWIIFEDITPPNFGVLPTDVQILGTDRAIVNGTDTVLLTQIGELVNTDELMETIFVEEAFDCVADLDMPQFSNLRDNCTAPDDLLFSYVISDPNATVADDGSQILNISAGVHELNITATDQCGNQSTHTMTIVVLDRARPIAMCQERIHLSFAQNQDDFFTRLPLDVIDDGSFDACGDIILRLGQRLDNKVFCDGRFLQFIGTEFIEFCCEDVGNIIPVQLTVFDEFGNTTVCTTEVFVEDKFVPEAVCFELDMDCSSPTVEDLISAIDVNESNCFDPEVQFGAIMGPDQCGSNSELVDVYLDGVRQCAIQVNYSSQEPFDPLSIKWPAHRDGSRQVAVRRQCDSDGVVSTELTEVYLAQPLICDDTYKITEPSWCQVSCNLIGLSHEVTSFGQEGLCRTDIIDWTIIDWCTYETTEQVSANDDVQLIDDRLLDSLNTEYAGQWIPSSEAGDTCARCVSYSSIVDAPYYRYRDVEVDGHYTYQQIIKVIDDTDPAIMVSTLDTIYRSQENSSMSNPCQFSGTISAQASDFCGDDLVDDTSLSWHVIVNGFFDGDDEALSIDTFLGMGTMFDVVLYSDFDRNEIIWSVTDNCQNSTNAHSVVYVQDDAVAAPICLAEVSLGTINHQGITLHPQDFAISTISDCEEVEILGISITGDDQDIVDKLHLSCEELSASDSITLRLWSVDRFDNRNFCEIIVRYRLSSDCSSPASVIRGTVNTIFGEEMPNVEVGIFNAYSHVMSMDITDNQGRYLLDQLKDESDYLKATKDNSSLAGISTLDIILLQQYVLGLRDIENPYLLWAGDINQDGRITTLDLIMIRAALLGVDQDNGVGDWIFFEADQYISASIPIVANAETIDLTHRDTADDTIDLLGMKYGDVSGDAYLAGRRTAYEDIPVYYDIYQSISQETKALELRINHDGGISGFEMNLNLIDVKDVIISSGDIVITSADYAVTDDGVKLIWVKPHETDLASITLTINLEGGEHSLLTSGVLSGKIWSESLAEHNVALTESSPSTLLKVSVYPNPFIHKANLRASGLTAENMDLRIYNGLGRLIQEYTDISVSDGKVLSVNADALDGSGLYYYTLSNEIVSVNGNFIVL
jgi:uncharacterized repeat protein (TIGR01451 family)